MVKKCTFLLIFFIACSLNAFDHKNFLAPWQDLIEEAFQEKIKYHEERVASKERILKTIAQQERPSQNNINHNTRVLNENRYALQCLQSKDLILDHIRVTYYEKKQVRQESTFYKIYLQLASSWYWHFLDFKPTYYRRDEKKLDKQVQELEKIIPLGKKPEVSIRLSKKKAFHIPFFQESQILYTIHLNF